MKKQIETFFYIKALRNPADQISAKRLFYFILLNE